MRVKTALLKCGALKVRNRRSADAQHQPGHGEAVGQPAPVGATAATISTDQMM